MVAQKDFELIEVCSQVQIEKSKGVRRQREVGDTMRLQLIQAGNHPQELRLHSAAIVNVKAHGDWQLEMLNRLLSVQQHWNKVTESGGCREPIVDNLPVFVLCCPHGLKGLDAVDLTNPICNLKKY